LKFGAIGVTKLIKVSAGEFEPPGKGVATDDGGAQGHVGR
jgi:hypothetical protein